MAFVTADVVPNPGGEAPFKVVVKQGENLIAEWPVQSQAEGEQQIMDIITEALEDDD